MTINKNASEHAASINSMKGQFQNLINYLSLYFSSQLKHADLSVREIGFDLFFSFTLRLSMIFVFLTGFVLTSYGFVEFLYQVLLLPDWIAYLSVGGFLIFFPLLVLFIFQAVKKKIILKRKIRSLQEDHEKNPIHPFDNKIKTEKEFLEWERDFYKKNLIHSFEKLKSHAEDLISIQHWVKKFPWESTGISLFIGFAIAIKFDGFDKTISSVHSSSVVKEKKENDFFTQLVNSGAEILREIIPPLVISHVANKHQVAEETS